MTEQKQWTLEEEWTLFKSQRDVHALAKKIYQKLYNISLPGGNIRKRPDPSTRKIDQMIEFEEETIGILGSALTALERLDG